MVELGTFINDREERPCRDGCTHDLQEGAEGKNNIWDHILHRKIALVVYKIIIASSIIIYSVCEITEMFLSIKSWLSVNKTLTNFNKDDLYTVPAQRVFRFRRNSPFLNLRQGTTTFFQTTERFPFECGRTYKNTHWTQN